MAGFNTVFKRVEVKYFIPKEKIDAFKRAVDPYMQLDDYGLTTIMNIYYDNEENDLLVRSLAKPKYKEKLRLRTYGIPGKDSTAFIELKKKADGIVYKRRAAMKLSEAERFLNEGIAPEEKTQAEDGGSAMTAASLPVLCASFGDRLINPLYGYTEEGGRPRALRRGPRDPS